MSDAGAEIAFEEYHGDEFEEWNAQNNPNRRNVLQRQERRTPLTRATLSAGGYSESRRPNRIIGFRFPSIVAIAWPMQPEQLGAISRD